MEHVDDLRQKKAKGNENNNKINFFAEFAEKEIKIQTYKSKEYFIVFVLRLAEGRNFPQNRQYYFL